MHVEAHDAPRELAEQLVLLELGPLDEQQEVEELLLRVGAEADVAVLSLNVAIDVRLIWEADVALTKSQRVSDVGK